MPEIHADTLDRAVAFYIASDLKNRKDHEEISKLLRDETIIKLLRNKKAGIDKSINNVLHAVSQCYSKEMSDKLRILNQEKDSVETQIQACQNHTTELTEENIFSVCNRFAKYLISSEDVEVRQFLKATINEILVSRDDVQISLNIA